MYSRTTQAKKLIKQFQIQDDMYIERKREILRTKNRSSEIILRKRDTYCRDPDRLLKPTKQWIRRTEKNNENSSVLPINLNYGKL